MNNLDKQYTELLSDILRNGVEKKDRTGTGTISVFGRQTRHRMSEGFPLLTTKRMAWKQIVTELLWFLRGDTNIQYLVQNGCHIWDGDAYKNYEKEFEKGNAPSLILPVKSLDGKSVTETITKEEFIAAIEMDDEFAKKWGDLGPIYGKQWREWSRYDKSTGISDDLDTEYHLSSNGPIDQFQNLLNDLRTNPDSRRLMVNAWNAPEIEKMVLPPCHYGFQVYTRELSKAERYTQLRTRKYFAKWDGDGDEMEYYDSINVPRRAISLMWNQRSVDTFLGLPFNIASYGVLLCLLGEILNMVPDELIGNLGDTHLYSNHLEQAREQISREPYALPQFRIYSEFWATETFECGVGEFHKDFDTLLSGIKIEDFQLENYQSHPSIKAPLSN